MKILFVNQTFYPDVAATAQYLTDLALHLVKTGHQVTILTSRRSYFDSGQVYQARETHQGIEMIRVWSFGWDRNSKWLRVLDALFLNLLFGWHLLWLTGFDQMIAMTTPPLIGWVTSHVAKWRRSKFTYWVMDINPDQLIQAGWIRAGGFCAYLAERILRGTLKRSNKVIVLDRFMKENILSKGISSEKVEVISLWAPEEIVENILHPKNSFRVKHQLNGKFVIMYSGNLSICHPVGTILQAALLLKNDPLIQFLFVGGGERLTEVLNFKEKHSLLNMACLPYQKRDQLKDSLSAADLHVVVMGNSYTGIVHPSKIYGILAVGRPFIFIGPKRSSIGELIKETGVGKRIEHGDVSGFIRTIHETRRLSSNEKSQVAQQSIALKNSRFNQEKLTQRFAELICDSALSR